MKKDDTTDLNECLVTELTVNNEKYFLTSQKCDQFSDFCNVFNILLNNIAR